jgi:hypothetical protein
MRLCRLAASFSKTFSGQFYRSFEISIDRSLLTSLKTGFAGRDCQPGRGLQRVFVPTACHGAARLNSFARCGCAGFAANIAVARQCDNRAADCRLNAPSYQGRRTTV